MTRRLENRAPRAAGADTIGAPDRRRLRGALRDGGLALTIGAATALAGSTYKTDFRNQ